MSGEVYIRRLNAYHRVLHVIMASSFFGLVITGMPLKYSYAPWAGVLVRMVGGYQEAGLIHRVCAAATFGYFFAHFLYVTYFVAVVKRFRFNPFGPDSMVPRWKDIKDIYRSFRWFFGLGERPRFDRWTYWEKFDYWAVFWGVGVIGVSGLTLWFPEFFSRFLPGWIFNVTTIIHSDEALLAAGFIFTVHFFNTHLRPEKFPMDMVIFTGRLTEEQMKAEKPLELQRIENESNCAGRVVPAPPGWLLVAGRAFGSLLLFIGLVMLVLIILGQFIL
ncbi:MAG: hypothetical protein P8Y66_09845 [Nitrospirota bacterium]